MATSISLALGPVSAAVPGALYQQIVDAVKREIGAGDLRRTVLYRPFVYLPQELLVSVITESEPTRSWSAKASSIGAMGLGTFVAAAGHDRTRAGRGRAPEKAITQAIHTGREAGMSDRELLQTFKDSLKPAPSRDLSQRRTG